MRYSWLALAGMLLIGQAGYGQQQQQQQPVLQLQQPQQPAPVVRLDPNVPLDNYLMQWEAKMKQVERLAAKIVNRRIDQTFKTEVVFEGVAKYMRPNLALMDLRQKDRPNVMERFVCTGTYLYEYKQATAEIRVHELPPGKSGQVADDNFLSFMFGMRAEEAKARYEISLFKEDPNYIYLKILPRRDVDRQDFSVAFLALTRSTFFPRQLIFDDPKSNRNIWDIPIIQNGVEMDRREFTQPELPRGWKFVPAPKLTNGKSAANNEPPPRVVREKQPE
jgi:TIGR03009 family protein